MAQFKEPVEDGLWKSQSRKEKRTMSTSSPVVASSSPFASWRFEHAAIRVPDFEAAVAWYSDKLDFRLIKSSPLGDKLYGFLIAPAVDAVFTVELVAGPGAESRPAYDNLGSSLKLSGLHHLGFRVDSVDDAIAELKRRRVNIVSEPHDVPNLILRVAFFTDPWAISSK
jgi:catechol 2,3-dioxygenase-like lactoylglutathione lyase family enzyme